MIELVTTDDGRVELLRYSDDLSLVGLADAIRKYVEGKAGRLAACRRCGDCCTHPPVLGLDLLRYAKGAGMDAGTWARANLLLPDLQDLSEREEGIRQLMAQTGLDEALAAVLYECNQSQPLTFPHDRQDRCIRLRDGFCAAYADRPFICGLYHCMLGERLQSLSEIIVSRGTWHAYYLLGAVPRGAVEDNPFFGRQSWAEVRLKDFDVDLQSALEPLFSYF